MLITNPKIELTNDEVKSLDTVIKMCDRLRDLDPNFLALIFDDEFICESFEEVVEILREVRDHSSWEVITENADYEITDDE